MTTFRRSAVALLVAASAALPPLVLVACGALGSGPAPTTLEDMTADEFGAFDRRLSSYMAVGVQGLLEEEVLEAGDLERVALILEGISRSTVPAGASSVLERAFGELGGWESAALGLLLLEVDLMLERRGAWASPRCRKLLESAAEAVRGGVPTEEELESAVASAGR